MALAVFHLKSSKTSNHQPEIRTMVNKSVRPRAALHKDASDGIAGEPEAENLDNASCECDEQGFCECSHTGEKCGKCQLYEEGAKYAGDYSDDEQVKALTKELDEVDRMGELHSIIRSHAEQLEQLRQMMRALGSHGVDEQGNSDLQNTAQFEVTGKSLVNRRKDLLRKVCERTHGAHPLCHAQREADEAKEARNRAGY
jgi:hypothetical protein